MSLLACKEIIEPENGIRATGDYAGFLTKRIYQNTPPTVPIWEVTSITDSTKITYPTFSLTLTETRGALVVRENEKKPLRYYYVVNHKINVNDLNSLEITDIQFLVGGGINTDDEIIQPDNTKTIILNGKLRQ